MIRTRLAALRSIATRPSTFVLFAVAGVGAQLVVVAPTPTNAFLALVALFVVVVASATAQAAAITAHDRAVRETYAKVTADLQGLGQEVADDGRVVDVETRTNDEILTSIEEKVDHALDIVTGAKR